MVVIPAESRRARVSTSEKREAAMTLASEPTESRARRAIVAIEGPIFPPAPKRRMSPSTAARTSPTPSRGVDNRSSRSTSLAGAESDCGWLIRYSSLSRTMGGAPNRNWCAGAGSAGWMGCCLFQRLGDLATGVNGADIESLSGCGPRPGQRIAGQLPGNACGNR